MLSRTLLFLCLFVSSPAWAATYYVTQAGSGSADGSAGNPASLATFEAGSGVFANLDGDTVCFSGSLQSASGDIAVPDYKGSSGSTIVLDGDCASSGIKAVITVNDGTYGINMDSEPQYITLKNFTINSLVNKDAIGVRAVCTPASGPCRGVKIQDNSFNIYGASGGLLCYGILMDGDFRDIVISGNELTDLNTNTTHRDPFDAISLAISQCGVNHAACEGAILSNIHIFDNTITGWIHTRISVILGQDSNSTHGALDGIYIYRNTLNSGRRHYGRNIGVSANPLYALGTQKNIYVFDNLMSKSRAPNQISGQNLVVYNNVIANAFNQCDYPDNLGCPDDYSYQCTDGGGDTFGDADHVYWGDGQGIVFSLDEYDDIYFFNNTFYNVAESALQGRSTSGDARKVGIGLNIFKDTASAPMGTFSSSGVCRTWEPEADDDHPPGSTATWTDYPIAIQQIATYLDGSEIFGNLFHGGHHAPDVVRGYGSGETAMTVAELEAAWTGAAGELLAGNNEYADPLMVSPATGNYALQEGSPAIVPGIWLSTISTATGSGTTLTVSNAHYLGVPKVGSLIPGQTLKTQNGQTTVLQSVNYATHEITVSPSISWTQNEGISIDYAGTSRDAGAEEYGPVLGTGWAVEVSGKVINLLGKILQ